LLAAPACAARAASLVPRRPRGPPAQDTCGAPSGPGAAVRAFTEALNRGDGPGLAAAWPSFDQARPALAAHRRAWADTLAAQTDLASGLVEFARERL